MNQFVAVAGAHFLALLLPGPDFFLITHSSLTAGWRRATGVCAGIAAANAMFIGAAFAGLSILRPDGLLFAVVQLAGGGFLGYLGVRFLMSAGSSALELPSDGRTGRGWWKLAVLGYVSAALNPKNALFYVGLATALTAGAGVGRLVGYGAWMFTVVLIWDLLVACLVGNRVVLTRFAHALPVLRRVSGVALLLLGSAMVLVAVLR